MTGPYADYAAERAHRRSTPVELGVPVAGAADRPRLPPLKAPGHHATLLTATVAATAFLAAVDRAERSGIGEHVDFSVFAAAARMTETAPAGPRSWATTPPGSA